MFGPQGRLLHSNMGAVKKSRRPSTPPLRGPLHHNNGLNSGLPSILQFCTAAVALAAKSFSIMMEQEEVEGKEGWRWELTTTLNYTVVSSPLADNWTCNHNRGLFSSPHSHAPGRRDADVDDLLTPLATASPHQSSQYDNEPLGEHDSLGKNEFLQPLTGTANGSS